ncbi:MAG TPA: hypothetical protein VNG51_25485 [Ktedonobacteraceae bacterium]|nr:hypothetical protein [Ktedonobacteraceae bacterium]
MQKRTVFILSGAAVLLIALLLIGFLVVAPAITSANSTPAATPTVTAIATPSTPTTGSKKNQIAKILKQNGSQILNQIAQGLHMTPAQLKTQLQSGKTLSQIATTQNVSATQLQIIVTNVVKSALQPSVDNGTINQLQVNALVKRLQKKPLVLERILKTS